MALTPRSFLRSPTLLVAALFSGVIAMFGIAVFASVFHTTSSPVVSKCKKKARAIDPLHVFRTSSCAHTLVNKPMSPSKWYESDFVELAACLDANQEAPLAVKASVTGLRYYPQSEALHNIRGYNLIVQEKYDDAVHALRSGISAVGTPTDGTMHNNLAWAGLFASETMTLSEARQHYRTALRQTASCEALHTGMWVEYGVASRSNGSSRDAAIDTYWNLRGKYEPCTSRAYHGDRITKYEVAGAGILDAEMTKLGMVQMFERFHDLDEGRIQWKNFDTTLVSNAVRGLDIRTANDIQNACEDIAPVKSAQPECRKALLSAR